MATSGSNGSSPGWNLVLVVGEVRSSHLIKFKKYDYKYIFHYIKCAKENVAN